MLGAPITNETLNSIMAQMLFLEKENPEKDVHFYISSPGGSVSAGLGIYDIMQFIKCDVSTYCIGMAASMGSLLLCAGTAGKRYILPHARVMIHQPLVGGDGISGQESDIAIEAKEMAITKKKLTEIYAKHTKKDLKTLSTTMNRNHYMSPQEALDFNLVDHIVFPRKEKKVA